jgi:hypothetical protein
LNFFFLNSNISLSALIKNILDKCLEFKEIFDVINKKINYLDRIKSKMINEGGKLDEKKMKII